LHSLLNIRLEIDSLAQQVEHNTFNVGVMGSSPMRVTISEKDFPLREVLFSYMVRAIEREKALKAAGKEFL
jgi:hypothetical protein